MGGVAADVKLGQTGVVLQADKVVSDGFGFQALGAVEENGTYEAGDA